MLLVQVRASHRWLQRRHQFEPRLFIAAFAMLFAYGAPGAAQDADRGKYLVEALMACDNCHTPRAQDGYDLSRRFAGGSQVFSDKSYSVRGSNISADKETGVGAWTDAELRAAITEGRAHGGRLAPVMPSESYRALTPSDLESVIAFLRSAPPVKSDRPAQERRGALEPRPAIPDAESPFAGEALADPRRRGLYVASLARCMGCHSGEVDGLPDLKNHLGQGGKLFRTPAGVAVASNITSDATNGVGAWSDDELKRAVTQGIGRDGKALAPTMANLSRAHFSKMSGEDLDALVAWLRTVPPGK